MAKFAGLRDPVTLDFENSTIAYCVDAFSISMGSLMGTSPVTAFVESATGISEGGKTGITAIVVGIMFFVSVFFAPIFASIPSWATGGALVIVGSLMIRKYAVVFLSLEICLDGLLLCQCARNQLGLCGRLCTSFPHAHYDPFDI